MMNGKNSGAGLHHSSFIFPRSHYPLSDNNLSPTSAILYPYHIGVGPLSRRGACAKMKKRA
jgi:hypothetical protein